MQSIEFHGDNLRIARLTSGFSLQELGDLVCASRQHISQLETTDKKPSAGLLEALCFELKVEPEFFSTPMGNLVKDSECHFRKLASVPVSASRECTARITLMNRLVGVLDELLELPAVDVPECELIHTNQQAAALARTCREHWKLGRGPIASVARVIERAGGVITTFGEVSQKVDALSVFRDRPIVILNQEKSRPRIRFDLAHELGHIVMHRAVESGGRDTEEQADQFASHFLLPQEALLGSYKPGYRIDWSAIKKIKVKWGVSIRAIIFRLRQAGLLTPSQYRTANIQLSKMGWTKSEELDDAVPDEQPELLSSSLLLLGETYGGSFGGLLKRLGISKEVLANITNCHELLSDARWEELDSNVVPFFPNRTRQMT